MGNGPVVIACYFNQTLSSWADHSFKSNFVPRGMDDGVGEKVERIVTLSLYGCPVAEDGENVGRVIN